MKKKNRKEIKDYDQEDTASMIDTSRPIQFEDLGLKLPKRPPTQVVSIRLPSGLLNEIRAVGSQRDVPYQSLIKIWLAEALAKLKKKAA